MTTMAIVYGLLLMLLVSTARAFPGGAPFDTCLSMFPKHSSREQQAGPPPFNISFTPLIYSPSLNITVTITAWPGHVIRGIQIRAHRADVNFEQTLGRFLEWPDNKVQPLNCFGDSHNMITHKNNEPVSNITLVWKAPSANLGDIKFDVTLVQSYDMFWSHLSSEPLQSPDPDGARQPYRVKPEVNTSFAPVEWKACGKSKGCLLYPRHCWGSDCYAGVTFAKDLQGYTFEMFAQAEGYVSVGFSYDKKMGDDQTITCTAQGERVTVQNGYNHKEYYNERMIAVNLTNLQTMQEDGMVYCRFTRPEYMELPYMESIAGPLNRLPYDLSIDYYLMLAWGYTYQDSDSMKIHTELPIISDSKISFRRYEVYRGSSVPYNSKVHGCLMMVAWIAMAGVTVVVSRYFREGDGATFCLGAKAWFQVHRLCACIVFGLTAAGLAIILVHLNGKITERKEAYDHACVGFTVVALVCVQVVLGFLRPSPSSKIRFVFNWVHRLLGKCAQILSAVAMLLAFQWQWMPSVMRHFGIIVLGCWIGAQVLAEILLEIWHRCNSRKTATAADMNLDEVEPREKQEKRRKPSMVPLFIYLVVPAAAVCAGLCSLLLF